MILPQLTTSSVFPDDNIPEKEKLTQKFAKAAGRALYAKFCFGGTYFAYGQWPEMQETRNYGGGQQSKEPYVNRYTNGSAIGNGTRNNNSNNSGNNNQGAQKSGKGNRKAFANIGYDIYSNMQKLTNVILSMLSDNDYKLDCVSLDKNVVSKKKEKREDIYIKSKVINPIAKELGLPEMYVPFVPKDEAQMEMADRLGFFKTRQEVALEKLAQAGFRAGNWSRKRVRINNDAKDFGFRIAQVYTDKQSGLVKFRYVDPCTTVMLWSEDEDAEPVAIGHITEVSIQSVFNELLEAGFTEQQIQSMAKANSAYQVAGTNTSPTVFEAKDATTNRWLWLDFKIYVLHFEYLSTDYKHYATREVNGTKYYQRVKNPKALSKKEKVDYDEYRCNYWYEGHYIISSGGQDMVYGWRKKPNQMQKGLSPMSSYVFDRMLGQSHTRRVRGLLDDLMMAKLKLRAAVAAAAPKGYAIDIGNAANVVIGGVSYDLFDLIHIQRQNGIRVVSTKFNAATGKYQANILQPEDNGLGPQGMEWINQIVSLQNEIMDVLGIPEVTAASSNQSGERLPGVMEMDNTASNNANWLIKEHERFFKEKLGERLIHQARINIEYDKECRELYEGLIGPDLVEALDEMEGLSLEQMGISTRVLPTEKEKDAIIATAVQMSQIATRDGSTFLKPSSVERVRQLLKNDDVDEALWFMDAEETAAKVREEQNAAQMAEMTIKGQQETVQVAEQAKQETAKILGDIEVDVHERKNQSDLEKEKQLVIIKGGQEYQKSIDVQQMKGEQKIQELTTEAVLQVETGMDIRKTA